MRILYVIIGLVIFFGCHNENKIQDSNANNQNKHIVNESEELTANQHLTNEPIWNAPIAIVSFWDDTLLIYGKHKLDIPVYILNHKSETIYETKTIGYNIVPHVEYDIWTKIKNQPTNDKSNSIAIFGKKPTNYKEIKPEQVDENLVNFYDSLMRQTHYLDTLKDLAIFLCGNQKLVPKPEVRKFKIFEKELFVLTYIFDNQNYGPRFIFYNNKFKLLNKEDFCSSEEYFVFYMNNEYFVQNQTLGCGTGITGLQIYKLTKNSISDYFEEFGLSD